MLTPPFAFLESAKDAITEFAHNCLLVAGGFLVGYVLGGILGWAAGKYVLRQQAPETAKKLGRTVGGVVLALIVALLVFTGKGRPGGDGGDGKGAPEGSANKANQPSTPDPNPRIEPKLPPRKVDLTPADLVIPITILEGADVPAAGKFYRVENGSPLTLDELK